MTERCCETCAFWERDEGAETDGADQGECRRHAPVPSQDSFEARWPVTAAYEWCGEHRDPFAAEIAEMTAEQRPAALVARPLSAAERDDLAWALNLERSPNRPGPPGAPASGEGR